ncbi:uncharacterized protein LOC133299752 [Gastrolobium bilobum]|uniref:uncharacterized protein LOC133299752 n=1 Tax=Gastrolobium bilobum TaxID=150636 RepID=UPI002AB2A540|nr:uncharacterized protein LOC133299752 [Gastrolobium bilobum]
MTFLYDTEAQIIVGVSGTKLLLIKRDNARKDLAQACSDLTVKAIISDLDDDYFSLLVDEARDVAIKEQMAVLQLALMKVAKHYKKIQEIFDMLQKMATVVGGSCKQKEILQMNQYEQIVERIARGEIPTGKDEPKNDAARTDAGCILYAMEDFEFAFLLHLMQLILGISYELSQALQRKDQDFLNAIDLVKVV